jgi:hypothetical protein
MFTHVYTLFGPCHPSLSHPPTSRQNLFCPLVFCFCWRENIRDNNKDIAFLLVWDKDSYTERFLALLPCTCVLQPTSVHYFRCIIDLKDMLNSNCDSNYWRKSHILILKTTVFLKVNFLCDSLNNNCLEKQPIGWWLSSFSFMVNELFVWCWCCGGSLRT